MTKPAKTFFTAQHNTLIGIGLAFVMGILAYFGLFYQQKAVAQDYPVQGFDVSHHQGDINWKKISPDKFQFVYLKATEGGDYKDSKFQENWLKAREQGFHVGAYHFYRLCRDGKTQADNFIATVPKKSDALPPVIDLEYDSNCINTYTKEQLIKEIGIMHDRLKQHYDKQPIFYISKTFYHIVLVGNFSETPLWVRDYEGKPELKDKRKWLFWQHSNQGKIVGIAKPVDLNVYEGSVKQWQQFLQQQGIVKAQ
ncbi:MULTISPECIES: GH25 family lysozyme [Acinetobacter calcoaceticus/baumannii complex]|uniref:glycoside hydrolase family 25 protein n=1 Tax=Acinetobacter calcoaceticus/baumannii complex TaxID=909768 RepID=UPI0009C1834A|nr:MULTISPECIES: GH25 family lysozyme [Acinetobacter calcoaceticus/baumannii complex]ARD30446.1 lysozyme [Acinetobacter lactucae]QWZ60806.1 glycoside hydrolase family 25 protein [Acinetobacter pittii]